MGWICIVEVKVFELLSFFKQHVALTRPRKKWLILSLPQDIYIIVIYLKNMPEISRFYGLIILMFFNEHNPPHFHVTYGDYKAIVDINEEVVRGFMPKRALKILFEWMELHKEELLLNWEKCQYGINPDKIEPLN